MVDEQEREILRESGLARKYCRGEGKRFKDKRCEHFDVLTWECVLLRNLPMVAVYEKRCLPKRLFYQKAHIFLTKYREDLWGVDVDLEEFIFGRHDVKNDRKGILEYELQVPAIHYMHSLINRGIKQEIERILKRKALVPGKRQCGNCIHRGPTEPHICGLAQIRRNQAVELLYNEYFGTKRQARDSICDGFVAIVPRFTPLDDEPASLEGSLFGSHSGLRLGALGWKVQLEQFEAALDVPAMFKAIRNCTDKAKTGKAAARYQRWYEDNLFIYHKLLDGTNTNYTGAKSLCLDERTANDEDREAYSTKMRRDAKDLAKCLSGKERCRELDGSKGEGL